MHPGCTIEQVYLYREPIDFRKAIDGLSVLVEQELGLNPFASALYVFTNRGRSAINSRGRMTPKMQPEPSVCRNLDGCLRASIYGEIDLIKH